ncbi:LPO_1073/Vpar_1526 family protein [Chryseobacterium sp. H1D6B]|uniref:LPO_1073/Vpar_1526 family protein n=1 Tax=Chryseobacterium sp. H1D6B TaxID=2940588 RepID=UPI0015CD3472|nr:LPO_1073/Vpar_1526 family protein [Chryseobacterium sp. H1D6B]
MGNKQTQSAGDNSQQLQATNMVVNFGIDEKRAREIYQEMNLQLRKDYFDEALKIANSRVTEFENKLMPKMEAVDGALGAFADPSFQLLLVEAQKTAAASERPADYDLLAELLIHRFQKGENRIAKAGISRAVKIVDEISDDALLGITVFHSVNFFMPVNGNIEKGLNDLDELFNKIIYNTLPTGPDWLDHLDILDAVRMNHTRRLAKISQYYSMKLKGYIDVGIEKNSQDYYTAVNILTSANLSQNFLIDHELNNNFKRLILTNINDFDHILVKQPYWQGHGNVPLSETQKNALRSIYDLYKKDESIKQNNINAFMQEWEKRPNLKILREWWDNINISFDLTSVGIVLAHSNAQRCDKNLPPLD